MRFSTGIVTLVTMVIGAGWVALAGAEQGLQCYYVNQGGTPKRVCEVSADTPSGFTVRWDCTSGPCDPCGICHTSAEKVSARGFDVSLHTQRAFPRATLTPTAPVAWSSGMTIGLEDGRLCARDTNRQVIHCYARDALMLKDSRGRPALIFSRTN
jgi:hypothetical protein